jgi:hypothetical protein
MGAFFCYRRRETTAHSQLRISVAEKPESAIRRIPFGGRPTAPDVAVRRSAAYREHNDGRQVKIRPVKRIDVANWSASNECMGVEASSFPKWVFI